MISSKSRFIRAMGKIVRVQVFNDAGPSKASYFAVYKNGDEEIFISENEIFLNDQKTNINYSEIKKATCLVDDNVLLDGVMLTMRDDSEFKINMSGHDGNIYDAHAFVRFLMRTLEDKSSKN
jgi:hypothetical protein